jgi:hypothetical protein
MKPRLRLALRVLKVVAFLGFTAYVVDVATTAAGPAMGLLH